jgi:hypothetical protein
MAEELLRVYVDARPVDVPRSSSVIDAIELADPALARAVRSGDSAVTDSRGLPIAAESPLQGGTILRVIPARKQQ